MEEYLEVNRKNWDSRVPIHLQGYRIQEFYSDPNHVSDVVRFDLPRLPDLTGLEGIHLQSHIGTDTLSLVRLGARMTALDFSEPALLAAKDLAEGLGLELEVVHSDVYSAVDKVRREFDFVYTGIGALCWLPDIRRWAGTVARLLRPGGFLFIREGHPVLWTIDDSKPNGEIVIELDYFEGQTLYQREEETYAGEGRLESPDVISFNHGLAEIFNSLWSAGLDIELFEEHQSAPWNPLADEFRKIEGIDEWELVKNPKRLPMTYTLLARKRI